MKILWITEFFPASRRGEITGGVEARCFFVSKYLRQLDHKVEIIARPTSGAIWYPPTLETVPERLVFTIRAIFSALTTDFDIIEATNSATYPIACLVGMIKRKPIVYWYPDVFQGTWVKNFGLVGILGEISDWIIFHLPAAKYIAISESTKNKLIAKGISECKITIIYCGAEVPKFAISKKFDICVVSRLVDYKKIEDLIRVVPKKIKVVIIGQGPERPKLEKLSQGKNISFFGHVASHKKVLEIIASSKILCHPSIVEGFGIVIIEAAALGIPFVARDIGVISEITHQGQGGLLFKNDLASAIKKLLTDDVLYKSKSQQARELAKKYTWKKAARQTEKVYENLFSY